MKDPRNESALSCLQTFFNSRSYLPKDFISKFLAVVSLKINITPTGLGFLNQSYNAKVIATNIQPLKKITKHTMQSRQDALREDAIRSNMLIKPQHRIPPQTLRLKFNDDLLPKCINAIADLSRTIEEGNRLNGYECDDYIKTNMLR